MPFECDSSDSGSTSKLSIKRQKKEVTWPIIRFFSCQSGAFCFLSIGALFISVCHNFIIFLTYFEHFLAEFLCCSVGRD
jgi:hypothetical protein